jgi:hypothetical protein
MEPERAGNWRAGYWWNATERPSPSAASHLGFIQVAALVSASARPSAKKLARSHREQMVRVAKIFNHPFSLLNE